MIVRFFHRLVWGLACCISVSVLAQTPITWETPQHVRVLYYKTSSVPMLTLHVAFKAGSAYDGEQHGLSALTASMLDQGNEKYSATQIADQLADTGALFSASASRDMTALSLNTLIEPRAYSKAIQVFKRILSHPDFPEVAFLQQKNQQLSAIRNEQESPDTVAVQLFFKTLYQQHPYAHPIYGTQDTLQKITRKDVVSFYQHYYIPENAVIVIVGAIDEAQAKQLSASLFDALPHGTPASTIPKATPYAGPMDIHQFFQATQTTLCLGQLGITHQDPHYFDLIVGNYILGGGSLTSELGLEVREKHGLTYDISSKFMPMPGIGPFLISLSTQSDQASNAHHLTDEITAKFIQHGPSPAELKEAKAYLMGSFPLTLASNADIAQMLLKIGFYNLPLDFLETYVERINAVTVQSIHDAFQKTLSMNRMLAISVGAGKP